MFLVNFIENQIPPKISVRVIRPKLSGAFVRSLLGSASKVKVAFGSKFSTLIVIVSPNGVLLCERSIDYSPLIAAPVRLAIIPVSTLIVRLNSDQIGVGCGFMKFLRSTVSTFPSRISMVEIESING